MKKFLVPILTSILYTLTSTPVFASCGAGGTFTQCLDTFISPAGNYTSNSGAGLITQLITNILPIVLGIAGFLTVIIIVVAGLQFIASNGDPKAAEAAKGRLTYAIIGFVVIILSFAILQIVNALFLGTKIA